MIDKKYPTWRSVPVDRDGRAGTAPAGLRVLEAVLTREFGADHVVVCCPDQLARFVRKATRIVAVPTHNPLGTTLMEARLIVAKVAQRCHLSLEPGQEVLPIQLMTVRPRDGMRMKLKVREHAISVRG